MVNLKQITIAEQALSAIGVNLDDYVLDISVNLCETIKLVFVHKSKDIQIIVNDPTNYPRQFEVT